MLNFIPAKTDVEVLIVGAGPAGSMAARAFAYEGREVLLIEKSAEVGRVVLCAEGISHESLSIFLAPDKARWIASNLNFARLYSPSGDYLEVRRKNLGYILERKIFDRFLVELALKEGAEIFTSTTFLDAKREKEQIVAKVLSNGEEKEIRSKLIIGADGAGSRVARSLGLKGEFRDEDAHYCAQYFLFHPEIKGESAMFFTGNKFAPGGYGWVFPKGDKVANVGVGVVGERSRAREFLDTLVTHYLPGAKVIGFIRGVVPTGGHRVEMVDDGVMLVGDAARLAEPLSGAGIASAMVSGDLAGHVGGEALKRGLRDRESLAAYPKIYWRGRKKEYEFSYHVRNALMKFTDQDFDFIINEIKPGFHKKDLEEISPFYIARKVFSSRRVLNLLLKVGKDAVGKYIREIVFARG